MFYASHFTGITTTLAETILHRQTCTISNLLHLDNLETLTNKTELSDKEKNSTTLSNLSLG
jgi:hypothetical protein